MVATASGSKLSFKGVAHPPPARGPRKNPADLCAAEIATTNLGKGAGTPMLVEHDHGAPCGRVLASWEGRNGELRVAGVIDDPQAMQDVRSGSMRGLSLGTGVVCDDTGATLMRTQDELSLCTEPRRGGCYIDTVDGAAVRTVQNFSKRSGAPRAPPPLAAPSIHKVACEQHIAKGPTGMSAQEEQQLASAAADVVSKETFEALQRELAAERAAKNDALARAEVWDTRRRNDLREMQPEVERAIQEQIDGPDGAPFKADLLPMAGWAKDVPNAANVESTTSMARLVTCFSAGLKRKTEEASANKEAAKQLADTNKQLEEITAERDSKSMRIGELETLMDQQRDALDKMEKELRSAGLMKEAHNFSLQTSRENASAGSSTAASSNAAGKQPMTTAAPAAVDDALFAHVMSAGRGGVRVQPSGSGHHFLGAQGGDSMTEAIRAAGAF